MQLRKRAIGLSLLATLTLLFGGWFLYQKMELETPLRTHIGQMKSAELTHLDVSKDRIEIKLQVTRPDLFPQEYRRLLQETADLARGKTVEVDVDNDSQDLEQIWMDGLFSFTEALDLHQYSRIPQMLTEWKTAHRLDEASALMDDRNVYVYLKKGKDDFYAIIPRSAGNEVTMHG
ncbi:hypothetical protein QO009_001279 [Brevibacillus aydinogluensis]|uniref:hypothetical protein n=1 Tax=Brevibacillus aydinogluensis TaxID=927786 RepID=UPI002893763A|nr:hypothetical protein [Brevibacillus aydinogluensis]MDT3415423.1 hypothetical protein [Brevibacillus aydinogluensis]